MVCALCVWRMLLSTLFGSRSLLLVAVWGSILQILYFFTITLCCAVGCSQIGAITHSVAMNMPIWGARIDSL